VREEYDKQEVKLLKTILLEGIKKNVFIVDNLDITANVIVTAMKGFEIPFFKGNENGEIEKRLNELIRILINGISIRK
jgi:hypothetical protein